MQGQAQMTSRQPASKICINKKLTQLNMILVLHFSTHSKKPYQGTPKYYEANVCLDGAIAPTFRSGARGGGIFQH